LKFPYLPEEFSVEWILEALNISLFTLEPSEDDGKYSVLIGNRRGEGWGMESESSSID
jgi:hypothetical protein